MLRWMLWPLAAALVVTAGCDTLGVDAPELPALDLSKVPLPRSGTGRSVLIEISNARVELDPTASDAIVALGECTDLITYCVNAERSLDACVRAARTCGTSRPWEEREPCCPSACAGAYQKARDERAQPIDAFESVFFLEPDCFPGVRALLEAQP